MGKDKKNQATPSTKPGGISTKSYRKPQTAKKAEETPAPAVSGGMSVKKKKTVLAIVASVLLVAIITTAVLIGVNVYNSNFEYLEYNLSRYLEFSGGPYKGYEMSLSIAKPHEKNEDGTGVSDVEMAIQDIIYRMKYENSSPVFDGEYHDGTVALGDRVRLRYRAYVLDSEGKEIEVNGYNNFAKTDEQIKSGNTVAVGQYAGFDFDGLSAALLGVNTADYAKFAKKTEGAVAIGDVVYISCERAPVSDSEKVEVGLDVRIDLGDGDTLAVWENILVGKGVGEELEDFTVTIDGVEYNYTETKIEYATTCEHGDGKPVLTVETYVPYGSSITALLNETVYLDVYIVGIQKYNPWHSDESQPYSIELDWNDDTVNSLIESGELYMLAGDEVNFDGETLSSYEGASLTEKFELYAWDYLMEDYETYYKDLYFAAMWEYYLTAAEIKRYPEVKVDEIYDEYYKDVIYQFEASGGTITYTSGTSYTYDTLDEYAVAYLTLASGVTDWEGHLYSLSEALVKERLILYYIMKEEDIVPTAEELALAKEKVREEYVLEGIKQDKKVNGTDTSGYTEEEYEAYVDSIRQKIFAYYDDEYFTERAYREIAYEAFIDYANVTTLDDVPARPQDK